jgi:hypothetical protein
MRVFPALCFWLNRVFHLCASRQVSVCLSPGEASVIVLRATAAGELEGYSYSYEYSYSFEPLL